MKIVATTSLPAVDRPNADRWNTARSRQNIYRHFLLNCKHCHSVLNITIWVQKLKTVKGSVPADTRPKSTCPAPNTYRLNAPALLTFLK